METDNKDLLRENTKHEGPGDQPRRGWIFSLLAGLLIVALFATYLLPQVLTAWRLGQTSSGLQDQSQISKLVLPALNLNDPDAATLKQLQKLQLIYDTLKSDYFRELSDAELIEAMYAGLLDEMESPYTFYLDSEEYAAMEESMQGEYYGIGAQVSKQDNIYLISDIFDDSPAARAGLHIGDQFLSVDGKDVAEFSDVTSLASAVRGPEGSTVSLEVFRSSDNQTHTLEVTRGKVINSNLKAELLTEEIGYIRILEFNSGVADNFIKALKDFKDQQVKSIIFDVRNNGGGYVYEVTKMLDYLLPPGTLAVAKGRVAGQAYEESWTSDHKAGVPDDWQYVVLLNQYSASASELFAGCLRDYDKAVLVGEQSFGKGVGTITRELTDGSALQITNFYYYLPKGDSVEGEGLAPQLEVSLAKEVAGLPLGQLSHEEDSQLQAALTYVEENYLAATK
ncbi:MAG: S41 family peptidase [Eubacteriales bacterium]|nr:S41 family peptidase [Eubacteriales bacterium]